MNRDLHHESPKRGEHWDTLDLRPNGCADELPYHALRVRRRSAPQLNLLDGLLWTVCVGIIVGVLASNWNLIIGTGSQSAMMGSLQRLGSPPSRGKETVSILILGTDDKVEQGRSDTMMVVTVGVRSGKAALLSIPRDSRVYIPRHGMDRINAAYPMGGAPLARSAAEALLGRRIDYYVKTDFDGFQRIVDLIGGVELNVEKRMVYRDRAQNLSINLRPGMQVLNGEDAMGYVRFRHDAMGYIGRIERQQKFICAVLKKMMQPAMLPRVPKILRELTNLVKTDIPSTDFLSLARLARAATQKSLTTQMVPGRPVMISGKSYWEVDRHETARLLASLDAKRIGEESDSPTSRIPISVEVLNGCGSPGAATRVAEELAEGGFEVTRTGNADRFDYGVSRIIDHGGHRKKAERVKSFLKTGSVHLIREEGAGEADVTVVLGRDFDGA